VLVTGSEGFVGRHLLEALGAPRFVPIISRVWLPDRAGLARLIREERPDAVIHLAAVSFLPDADRDPAGAWRANVDGTVSVLEALGDADPDARIRLVFVSSAHVYRLAGSAPIDETSPLEPAGAYGMTKLAAELACRAIERRPDPLPSKTFAEGENSRRSRSDDSGPTSDDVGARAALTVPVFGGGRTGRAERPLIIFRPFNHAGPGQRPEFAVPGFARQAALIEAGRLPPVLRTGNLSHSRDFTDVRDIARAYVLAAEGRVPPGTYNLASGRSVPLAGVAAHFRDRCRRPFEIQERRDPRRADDVPDMRGSAEKIRSACGWRPEIPFERTLDDVLGEWRRKVAEGTVI